MEVRARVLHGHSHPDFLAEKMIDLGVWNRLTGDKPTEIGVVLDAWAEDGDILVTMDLWEETGADKHFLGVAAYEAVSIV